MFGLVIGVSMVLGAVMGSFCCCQARRLRRQEEGKKKLGSRSVCEKCGRRLRWHENIPVLSWVAQKGRCRGCGKEIGKAEILSELVGVVMFGGLGWYFWGVFKRGAWANLMAVEAGLSGVFFVLLLIIGIYDAMWQRIPVKIVMAAIMVGIVGAVLKIWGAEGEWVKVGLEVMMAVGLVGGSYFLLYKLSNEKLVGGGDYLLGTAIGLFLGDWWLGLLTLFVANVAAVVVMVPLGKKKAAFGPFLVFGCWMAFIFSAYLMKLKLQF